jgi:ribosomal-protein-alanine N-acetyltransferase
MTAAFDPQFGEAWTRRQVSDSLVMRHTHYLLAGPAGVAPARDEPAVGFVLSRGAAGEEELLLIAVDPEHRGKGVGTALLKRLIDESARRGTERLFLEMRDGNPAERLYLAMGFVPVGRRRQYYRAARNGPLDAITYARDL